MSEFTLSGRAQLLRAARSGVVAAVTGRVPESGGDLPDELARQEVFGVFTTLRRGGMLRSCIGQCALRDSPVEPLGDLLRRSASHAASRDTRFPAIHPLELDFLEVEVSVLGPPVTITGTAAERLARVQPGRHGLILTHWAGRGLLLPQVAAERNWDAERFLEAVCLKAGVPARAWREPDAKLQAFESVHFAEPPCKREISLRAIEEGLPRLIADALGSAGPVSPALARHSFEIWTGILRQTRGEPAFCLRESGTLADLVQAARPMLAGRAAGDPAGSLSLLTHALPLADGDDGRRRNALSGQAIWIRVQGEHRALQLSREGRGDPFVAALRAVGLDLSAVQAGEVDGLAFAVWPCPELRP